MSWKRIAAINGEIMELNLCQNSDHGIQCKKFSILDNIIQHFIQCGEFSTPFSGENSALFQ